MGATIDKTYSMYLQEKAVCKYFDFLTSREELKADLPLCFLFRRALKSDYLSLTIGAGSRNKPIDLRVVPDPVKYVAHKR